MSRPESRAFSGWTSTEPVSGWQLLGAHLVEREIPGDPWQLSGGAAYRYCGLMGKSLADWNAWSFLLSGYASEVVRDLWGSADVQFGGFAGDSGAMETLRFSDLHTGPLEDDEDLEQVSEDAVVGLAFRPTVHIERGLRTGPDTLLRKWVG